MPSNAELYAYYCRRCSYPPNKSILRTLEDAGEEPLTVVDISTIYVGERGLVPVLDLVKNTKTVEVLDASANTFEEEQLQYLVDCLARHPGIRTLRLRQDNLHDGHATLLADLLDTNNAITALDVEGNHFSASVLRSFEATLEQNCATQAKVDAEEEAHRGYLRQRAASRKAYSTTFRGEIPASESGGYVHCATWWKNPQLCVTASRSAEVVFVLESIDGAGVADHIGLVLMRYDGVHRTIELTKDTIVAESPTEARRCELRAFLDTAESYVVMPYTFSPGRALNYAVTASLALEKDAKEEGWVTLEALSPRYDWCIRTEQGTWRGESAGGSGSCDSWRRNDMLHLRLSGQPTNTEEKVAVYVLLMKNADPDKEDEGVAGLDVVRHAAGNPGAPPLFLKPENVVASIAHTKHSSSLLHVEVPRGELDLFLVPSTKDPGVEGEYSVTVFASAAVSLIASVFPHGWHHRTVRGRWNESCCGGCRESNASWKANPAIEVTLEDPTRGLVACVEAVPLSPPSPPLPETTEHSASGGDKGVDQEGEGDSGISALRAAAVRPRDEVAAQATRRKTILDDYRDRHRTLQLEVSVMALQPTPPSYPILATSPPQVHATTLIMDTLPATLLIVPMLRHASDTGAYTIQLFCATALVVTGEEADTVAAHERAIQLAAYSAEDAQRSAMEVESITAIPSDGYGGDSEELRAARATVEAVAQESQKLFMDRDFPSGASSLFLDPDEGPPLDFPTQTNWRRASELVPEPQMLGPGASLRSAPCPGGPLHWFASVLQAIASKPQWLSRVFVTYSPEVGYAQFSFYKEDNWVGVTVDDALLVDDDGDLVYGRSRDRTDLLFALAEKAYAKLHRCYEALEPRVSPNISLLSLLQQGLMDLTGGGVSTITILRPEGGVELPYEERELLWQQLKVAIQPSRLYTLFSDSSSGSGIRPRTHAGLVTDHLYPVLDVRLVEQQRLVKLRTYGQEKTGDNAKSGWTGKWRFDSPSWTGTMREVLHYHEDEPYAVWMHFEEVLYYFTHLLHTDLPESRATLPGTFAESTEHDPPSTPAVLRNPQFAVHFTTPPKVGGTVDEEPLEVHFGLHRRDPRQDITRARRATAEVRAAIGLLVLAMPNTGQRVCRFEGADEVGRLEPGKVRDGYVTAHLSPQMLAAHCMMLIPFRLNPKDRDTAYVLSATCAVAEVKLHVGAVAANTASMLPGRWTGIRAGSPASPQWRNNPQFLLSVPEASDVTILVRPLKSVAITVGFTLHHTQHCSSFLTFDPITVVASAVAEVGGLASGAVRLAGMRERRGMPYVLVPYCVEDIVGDFEITVVGSTPARLRPIEPRLDWHRLSHHVSISADHGNMGGNPNYPSWRFNTQLALTLPVEREGRLLIAARRVRSADPRVKIGMLLLRARALERTEDGYRRLVSYMAEDVVATSVAAAQECVLDTTISLPSVEDALMLIVYADQPYKEAEVELSFYAGASLEVQPALEWAKTVWQEGSWALGTSAGGSRVNFANWINNPFFGISVVRPTRVVLLLLQYPRFTERVVAKRYGNAKAFLPPPIEHPGRCTAIELSVVLYDDVLTEVAATTPTTCAETILELELRPDQQYLVVPCTTEPQHNGDLKLFAFADGPVDLFEAKKPRLSYVDGAYSNGGNRTESFAQA